MNRLRTRLPAPFCLLMIAILRSAVLGQCTQESCPRPVAPHPAVVRVAHVTSGGSRCYGSGTLVYKDAAQGIVVTCAHLFRGQEGKVVVTFPDGRPIEADLVAVDRAWDLAAVKIAPPQAEPVTVAAQHPKPGDPLQSCGYGFDGRYWCNQGRALGYARTAGTSTHEMLELSGCARDGDSGGPVFNASGELVAVLWGTDGRMVGGTFCGRVRKFLAGVFSPGRLPDQHPGPAPLPPGASPGKPSLPGLDDHISEIRQRLDGLIAQLNDARQQQAEQEQSWNGRLEKIENAVTLVGGLKDRIDEANEAVGSDNLRTVIREAVTGVMAERTPGAATTILPAVLAALGWTGPPSLAAIFALRLVAGLLRRRIARRRRGDPRTGRPRPRRAKPLNDDYARQLAGVYALSGRSPIADATLGREYDEELRRSERSSDAAFARWARALRQRVARRFYRIHDESPLPSEPAESSNGANPQ